MQYVFKNIYVSLSDLKLEFWLKCIFSPVAMILFHTSQSPTTTAFIPDSSHYYKFTLDTLFAPPSTKLPFISTPSPVRV